MSHYSRHGVRMGRLIAMVLAAVLATVTGCASQLAPGRSAAPAQPPTRQEVQSAVHLLTVDATALRQRWQLAGAEQTLIQQCMRQQGLRYLVTDPGPEPAIGATTADTIGTATPPTYPVTGPPAGASNGVSAQDRYVQTLAAAAQARYLAAYRGPESQAESLALPSGAVAHYLTGGCDGQARAELYGSVPAAMADTFVPQDVGLLFQHFLSTDQPYQSALHTWQHCMAQAGWPATSPAAAINTLQTQAATDANPTALATQQHAEATADAHCDAASTLRRTGADQLTVFLERQPPTVLAWLDQIAQTRQQALRHLGYQ